MIIRFKSGESLTHDERVALSSLEIMLLGGGSNLSFSHAPLASIYQGLESDLIKIGKALQERNWHEQAILWIPESWGPEEHLLTLVEKIESIDIGNL
jgi:hypothetical protein